MDFVLPYDALAGPSWNDTDWQRMRTLLRETVARVNQTKYALSYNEADLQNVLEYALSQGGIPFRVVSAEKTTRFRLSSVLVTQLESAVQTRYKQVDFIVDNESPYLIRRISITPDNDFISTQYIRASNEDQFVARPFHIENQWGLFYPWATEDDYAYNPASQEAIVP